jgi:hypothetical protein
MDDAEYTRDSAETSWSLTVAYVGSLLAIWGITLCIYPPLHDIAITYLFMSLGAMTLGGLAYISHSVYPFSVLGFPKAKDILLPLAVGVTYGLLFVLVGGGVLSITRMSFSVASPYVGLTPIALILLYGICDTGAQDVLLQATALPIVVRVTKHKNIAIGIMSLAFAIMHYYIFGGAVNYMITAGVFYAGASYLTLYFKTATAGIAAHTTYQITVILYFLQIL